MQTVTCSLFINTELRVFTEEDSKPDRLLLSGH